jgi:hypothetical protein
MVIFSLTLMLLVVMVMMTLSIGSRVRDKLELDNLAEVAAYNDAVIVARTFNTVSLMNRAMISHMVALSGVQSLISWAGMYRGALGASLAGLEIAKGPYKGECEDGMGCGCASKKEIEGLEKIIVNEAARVGKLWDQLDTEAGNEAREIRMETLRIYADELSVYQNQLLTQLGNQTLSKALVNQARTGQRYPMELNAPDSSAVALREVNLSNACAIAGQPYDPAAAPGIGCAPFSQNAHVVWATMGTRGYAFVTGRGNDAIINGITSLMPAGVGVTGYLGGSGFFSDEESHGDASETNQQAWAHDHMSLTVTYGNGSGKCFKSTKGKANAEASVRSTRIIGDEAHKWNGGADLNPVPRHTVGGGMWPSFIDYNPALLVDMADNFGQPKLYSVMQRDYSQRPGALPWELQFNMKFTSTGSSLDLRGRAVSTSLATGVAYYHRASHWREPPNFMNPFWRATIMADDIDAQAAADVPSTLSAAADPAGARAYTLLRQGGYRGF